MEDIFDIDNIKVEVDHDIEELENTVFSGRNICNEIEYSETSSTACASHNNGEKFENTPVKIENVDISEEFTDVNGVYDREKYNISELDADNGLSQQTDVLSPHSSKRCASPISVQNKKRCENPTVDQTKRQTSEEISSSLEQASEAYASGQNVADMLSKLIDGNSGRWIEANKELKMKEIELKEMELKISLIREKNIKRELDLLERRLALEEKRFFIENS